LSPKKRKVTTFTNVEVTQIIKKQTCYALVKNWTDKVLDQVRVRIRIKIDNIT
jgi:hypothetical protein